MDLHLDCLTEGQRKLWYELSSTPQEFTLYGGVAIALRLGHRQSSDFVFFTDGEFEPDSLYRRVPYLAGAEVLQLAPSTLTCLVDRDGPVKLSFFGVPGFVALEPAEQLVEPSLKVASLTDLAGTKAAVIQKRAMARDYIDLDQLLTRGRVELRSALLAARRAYGPLFNPQITLKALTFFEDGDLSTLGTDIQKRLTQAVRALDLDALEKRLREES